MGEVQLLPANLATVCIESFLYGVFFVLATTSTYLLIQRHRILSGQTVAIRRRSMLRDPMLIAGIVIFCTVTTHWVFTVTRLFQAFVIFEGGSDPLFFYGDLQEVTEVAKTAVLLVSLLIGDCMIVYRLWIIWGYNKWVILPPIGTILGLLVCAIGITYQLAVYDPQESVFTSSTGRWITGDCVFTLCTNVYSSGMISYRIWQRSVRSSDRISGRNVMDVLVIVIESAAIYSAWTLFFFLTYELGTNLQYTAVDTWAAVAGISYMLINLRVGLGWAQKAYPQVSASTASGPGAVSQQQAGQNYMLRPLAVNVDRVVTHQVDFDPTKTFDGMGEDTKSSHAS